MKNFRKFLKFQLFAVLVTALVTVSILPRSSGANRKAHEGRLPAAMRAASLSAWPIEQLANSRTLLAYDGSEWILATHRSRR
jgi:hypothetical protein